MSYTPQLNRVRRTPPATPSLTYSPATPRRQCTTDRLIQPQDYNSDGCSSLYTTPMHQKPNYVTNTGTSYGTLQMDDMNNQIQVLEMSTPSSSCGMISSTTSTNTITAWIWMVLNVLILVSNTFVLLQPYWLTSNAGTSIGVISYCFPDPSQCTYYHTRNIYTLTIDESSWKVTLVLYVIACVLLCISGFLTAAYLCLQQASTKETFSFIAGYLQLIAGE